MPKRYAEWTPAPFDPATDALSAAVGRQEDRDVLRDPEIDAQPKIIHVGNRAPQPVTAVVDHYAGPDPSAPPVVDHVDAAEHLRDRQPSTDRFSDGEQGGPSGFIDEGEDDE